MAQLPHRLYQKITNFFISLPQIDDIKTRRALLRSAGLDEHLYAHLTYEGSTSQFTQNLVATLDRYGNLNDGRSAIEVVLKATQNYVGYDKREYCDRLIDELRIAALDSKEQRVVVKKQNYNINHSEQKLIELQQQYNLATQKLERLQANRSIEDDILRSFR